MPAPADHLVRRHEGAQGPSQQHADAAFQLIPAHRDVFHVAEKTVDAGRAELYPDLAIDPIADHLNPFQS